jgi:hypothetical protein
LKRAKCVTLKDKHPSEFQISTPAGRFIRLEIVGEGLLELQRNPTAHDADGVDRVDERFDISVEKVAAHFLNHTALSVVPDSLDLNLWFMLSAFQGFMNRCTSPLAVNPDTRYELPGKEIMD